MSWSSLWKQKNGRHEPQSFHRSELTDKDKVLLGISEFVTAEHTHNLMDCESEENMFDYNRLCDESMNEMKKRCNSERGDGWGRSFKFQEAVTIISCRLLELIFISLTGFSSSVMSKSAKWDPQMAGRTPTVGLFLLNLWCRCGASAASSAAGLHPWPPPPQAAAGSGAASPERGAQIHAKVMVEAWLRSVGFTGSKPNMKTPNHDPQSSKVRSANTKRRTEEETPLCWFPVWLWSQKTKAVYFWWKRFTVSKIP